MVSFVGYIVSVIGYIITTTVSMFSTVGHIVNSVAHMICTVVYIVNTVGYIVPNVVQWFSTFLKLLPFNTFFYAMVTPNINLFHCYFRTIISLLLEIVI